MAGTKAGGAKAAQTMKDKHGEDFYVRIGRLGGSVKTPKGFAVSGLAVEAGRKGGKGKYWVDVDEDFAEGFNQETMWDKLRKRVLHG